MDTSFTNQNINEIEQNGFITNCGPNRSLHVIHDHVRRYCKHLNSVANHASPNDEYDSIHLNEPSGDFIAIYKPDFYEDAMKELERYANAAAKISGISRNW